MSPAHIMVYLTIENMLEERFKRPTPTEAQAAICKVAHHALQATEGNLAHAIGLITEAIDEVVGR